MRKSYFNIPFDLLNIWVYVCRCRRMWDATRQTQNQICLFSKGKIATIQNYYNYVLTPSRSRSLSLCLETSTSFKSECLIFVGFFFGTVSIGFAMRSRETTAIYVNLKLTNFEAKSVSSYTFPIDLNQHFELNVIIKDIQFSYALPFLHPS